MNQAKLIIVCGLPGAGKTTLAKQLAEAHNGVRMCPDDWMADLGIDIWDGAMRTRIEVLQWRQAQELLKAGIVVIIEWGTWARVERDILRQEAQILGALAELHYINVAADVLWRRVRERGLEQVLGSRAMTREDINNYVASFEQPTVEELALFDASEVITNS